MAENPMPNREELEVGDRIIILDNYSGYKSMRGYHGNTCFVDINDIKPEPTIDSLLKSPTEKKEGE